MAEVAQRYGLWLHVDAAYAGPAAILEEYRHILDGASLADSLVLNPHKWLFTPMDLSVLYTRRPEVFRRALSLEETPAYLKSSREESAVNFSDYSVALGRRFRALKLWFVFRSYGREGIARILREHIRMARDLAEAIEKDPRFRTGCARGLLTRLLPSESVRSAGTGNCWTALTQQVMRFLPEQH